tara:strand:- start:286 stop:486 length:201 start_codon:yes stop_codon:yes gene_type:complete
MKITTPVLRGVLRLRLAPELTREASKRLKWFDYYQSIIAMPVSPAVASASARRPSTAGNAAKTLGS